MAPVNHRKLQPLRDYLCWAPGGSLWRKAGDALKREVAGTSAFTLRGLFPFLDKDFEEIISVGDDWGRGFRWKYGGQFSDEQQKAVKMAAKYMHILQLWVRKWKALIYIGWFIFLQYRLKCQINKRRLAVVCALHVCYHSWCFACGRKTWLATSIWSTVYWTADFTSWLPLVEECRNTQSAVCKDHLSLFPILQSNRLLYESLEDTQSKMATPRTVIWSDKLQLVLLIGEKYGSSVYLLSVSAD